MKSVKSKSAITWVINDKISVTFYELEDYQLEYAVSVFPSGTLFGFDSSGEYKNFDKHYTTFPGILTCYRDQVIFVDDEEQIWKVTRDGVMPVNRHEKLCKYFMDNGVLFEFDGQSTCLLMKNKIVQFTHFRDDWENMVSCGSLKIVHESGKRKLAKMVKAINLPISAYYEKELLELCK